MWELNESGLKETRVMSEIRQSKGEAECAQIDWVIEMSKSAKKGDVILSLVSSADIDAVVLHLFAMSIHLPRDQDGQFLQEVFVVLKKTTVKDINNITKIIQTLENCFKCRVVPTIATGLCVAGNDFLPKYHNMTHPKIMLLLLQNSEYRQNLFDITSASVDKTVVIDFIRALICG